VLLFLLLLLRRLLRRRRLWLLLRLQHISVLVIPALLLMAFVKELLMQAVHLPCDRSAA
jgi:hypothetical protein